MAAISFSRSEIKTPQKNKQNTAILYQENVLNIVW